jgi:uncharacterized membrane protein
MSLIPFPYKEIFDDQLKSFDLLIFDNFNFKPYWVEPYLPGVRAYIEAGGALAMVGGDLSFASGAYGESALHDVLPVELAGIPRDGAASFSTDTFRPRLTPEGRTHPVTSLSLDEKINESRWAALPQLTGINRVAGLRPGARALLVHPTQKSGDGKPAPVLATADVGKGRTLALLTDSAWNWGFQAAGAGDDGRAFQRFWEGAIRWLVRDPALTHLRIDLDKVEYRRGQTVSLRVRTLRADYSPAASVEVALELRPAEAPRPSLPCAPSRSRPATRARPRSSSMGLSRVPTVWSAARFSTAGPPRSRPPSSSVPKATSSTTWSRARACCARSPRPAAASSTTARSAIPACARRARCAWAACAPSRSGRIPLLLLLAIRPAWWPSGPCAAARDTRKGVIVPPDVVCRRRLAVALRVLWVLAVPTKPVGDFAMYVESAAHLVEHGAFDSEYVYMPGYIFLIAPVQALGGGWLATKLVGAVLGGLGAGAVYGIARTNGGRLHAGRLDGRLLYACWPAGIAIASVTGTDMPAAVLCSIAAAYFLVRFAASGPPWPRSCSACSRVSPPTFAPSSCPWPRCPCWSFARAGRPGARRSSPRPSRAWSPC